MADEKVHVQGEFRRSGQHSFIQAPAQAQDQYEALTNVRPPDTSVFRKRFGYTQWMLQSADTTRRLYEYQKDADSSRRILLTSTAKVRSQNEDGTNHNTAIFTPNVGATDHPRVVVSRDFAFFQDGHTADRTKWDGSSSGGTSNWGITAPATNLAVGAPTGGAVTLDIGRKYFVIFRNATTGHNSGLSPVSPTTGPVDAKDIPLTAIEVSGDSQADRKLILATADGGDETKLFFLADIPSAQTTLTDNITEAVLIASNIYLELDSSGEERGLSDNDRPLTFTLITKHRGRVWAAGNATNPQWVYFSKSIADLTTSSGTLTGRYEEAWPSGNFFDISSGAETVRALFTDGITLYVATERHIRRILGDGQTLQNPEILFNNVGVVNQDVWRTVFMEGTPAGTMFLTPDLKVIFTDFNVYHNVGEPIQDVLNNINTAAIDKSYAEFYSTGADDWYVLAVPTGANTEADTILVYDLGNRQWYTWNLSDKVTAQLLNVKADGSVQWLVAGDDRRIHILQAASTQDREGQTPDVPVSFTSTVQTTWRHLDTPQAIKILNKIKLFSSDAAIAVTIEGASTRAEFSSPAAVVTSSVPVSGPLGDLEVYLAGLTSKDRFYRYKFVSTADLAETSPMLSYWETYFVPYTVF